jgi:hypothetical protein
LPVFNIEIPINKPIDREPASPIINLLGSALNHKYIRIQVIIIMIIFKILLSICLKKPVTPIDDRVMTDRVPEKPSIPSEQFVTLMDTQISIVAMAIKSNEGNLKL